MLYGAYSLERMVCLGDKSFVQDRRGRTVQRQRSWVCMRETPVSLKAPNVQYTAKVKAQVLTLKRSRQMSLEYLPGKILKPDTRTNTLHDMLGNVENSDVLWKESLRAVWQTE